MMKLGGPLGYAILHAFTKLLGPEKCDYENNDPDTTSKLERFFGSALVAQLRGRTIVDFGCGRGGDAVAAARKGAARVVGLDINESYLRTARALAEKHGVADVCSFFHPMNDRSAYETLLGACDYVFSVDAFEHFRDPEGRLAEMTCLLKPGGSLLISFGPPWKHPYGAHQGYFSRVPWIQFLFSEQTIFAVRKNYVQDAVSRLDDTGAGLNRMTVARFRAMVRASCLEQASVRTIPVRGLRALADNPLTGEYFTSLVQCELRKPRHKISTACG